MGSPLAPHSANAHELKARLRAERTGLPFLVYRDDHAEQQLVLLDAGNPRRVIGRRSGCEIALAWDTGVSRAHALLEQLGDEWAISDDGLSSNGTWLRGERIRNPRILQDGDVITVGSTQIGFRRPTSTVTSIATTHGTSAGEVTISMAQRRVLVALCRPVLQAGAAPAANQSIANEVVCGVETVKSHLKALYERFGLDELPATEKRNALTNAAVRLGVVTTRDIT